MGVVQDRKNVCETAKARSDTESVQSGYSSQTQSDEEGEQAGRSTRQPLVRNGLINLAFNRYNQKNIGKRRARRMQNSQILETLTEEDEVPDVFESGKSKFQVLMESTDDALALLESYEAEQEQGNIVEQSFCRKFSAYYNIPRKIRVAISNKKDFRYDLLKGVEVKLENSQLSSDNAEQECIFEPETCYERLLIHAAAKYKGYSSKTFTQNGIKKVCVKNAGNSVVESTVMLCDYIKLLRI